MMTDTKYPLKGNTVPFWAVPLLAIMSPFVIILIFYFCRRDVYDLHHAILGFIFSVLLMAVITDAIKDAVGRLRPVFIYRCFPDGNATIDPFIHVHRHLIPVTKDVLCHRDKAVIKEGYKSFPSGHTSWSVAGLSFLSFYLSGKIRAFDRRGHAAKLCIVLFPYFLAALVGVSTVDDYWRHWRDVFTGALIGWAPHVFFRMIEERNGDGCSSDRTNRTEV